MNMKYELKQTIYYQNEDDVPCGAPVLSRAIIENAHDDWVDTETQKATWQRFTQPTGIFYVTIHGVYREENVFSTVDELLANIKKKFGE